MTRARLGWALPAVVTAIVAVVALVVPMRSPVRWGIVTGVLLAWAQSTASVAAMRWAWSKPYFYWVWGGGLMFRLVVFAATAFVVYRFTALSLVATLLALVTATTLFLVVESAAVFKS